MGRVLSALGLVLLRGLPARAADKAIGTFTVSGRTVKLTNVYASLHPDPEAPGAPYLVLLVSDQALTAEERSSERLTDLARAGRLRALKFIWKTGTDGLAQRQGRRGEPQHDSRGDVLHACARSEPA